MMLAESKDTPFTFVLTDEVRVLAVDDDPIQREFCAVYLSSPAAEVTTAESAEAALEVLRQQSFDILLVDVDMPGMNGIELVRLLRADPAFDSVPMMVITGRDDMVSIDAAYAAGASAFMCKPVNWRLLAHQVKFLLRAHRALQSHPQTVRTE
jgi:DNA-binding response OmpR family regulator